MGEEEHQEMEDEPTVVYELLRDDGDCSCSRADILAAAHHHVASLPERSDGTITHEPYLITKVVPLLLCEHNFNTKRPKKRG